MAAKIHDYRPNRPDGVHLYVFHCPGCGWDHPFRVGPPAEGHPSPRWTWNGSVEAPTFHPSLMCNGSYPASRCHTVITDGRIAFQPDCWHALAGQTVEMPDWDIATVTHPVP